MVENLKILMVVAGIVFCLWAAATNLAFACSYPALTDTQRLLKQYDIITLNWEK